jgi:hypothetical protein
VAQHRPTVDAGQGHIQQDQVGLLPIEVIDGGGPVTGLVNDEPGAFEE